MLNEVHIEGPVTRVWSYRQTRFARIANRLDPGRAAESDGRESEYITLRFEPPLARAARTLHVRDVVRASGYLSSREYPIILHSFAREAEAAEGVGARDALTALRALAREHGANIQKPHVLNEVVVERFEVVEEAATGREPQRRREPSRREATTPPVAAADGQREEGEAS